jgi:hypothetical protein
MTSDVDEFSIPKFLYPLAYRTGYCAITAKLATKVSDAFANAEGMGITGCSHSNLPTALLNAHK